MNENTLDLRYGFDNSPLRRRCLAELSPPVHSPVADYPATLAEIYEKVQLQNIAKVMHVANAVRAFEHGTLTFEQAVWAIVREP